jgi:hypothetical protein
MANAVEAIDRLNGQLAALQAAAHSGRSKLLDPSTIQPLARAIATTYFEEIRTELDAVKSRSGLVDEIDFVVQSILQLAADKREKVAYLGQLNELRPFLLEATIDLMKSRGSAQLVLSPMERGILDTLVAILPMSAASYEQALRDIAAGGIRVSWRGTATELRETLREVVDHLAPDQAVSSAPNFQMEEGQTRPTQRQKVRHILRARRSSSAAVAVAENSLSTLDEAIAVLARSTYQRSSVSAHVGTATGKEIKSLKRYVDALLAELLEIS